MHTHRSGVECAESTQQVSGGSRSVHQR